MVHDAAAGILVSIHYNLCLATIGRYARYRSDLQGMVEKLENWDLNGQYMLTELGHGLDVINMETTATFTTFSSGEGERGSSERKGFVLHTPSEAAQKWMPPTTPMGGVPKIAVVHARLIVKGEPRGIRMFVVPLTDGREMCKGVSAKFVGARGGTAPLDHALTRFTNVELPLNALLCRDIESELFGAQLDDGMRAGKEEEALTYFAENIMVVHPSKVALCLLCISALKVGTYLTTKYSLWREVAAKGIGEGRIPILTFRTQQIPCVYALAKSLVFNAWADHVTNIWTNQQLPINEMRAVSALFKQVVTNETNTSLYQFMQRCGAQGIFEHNCISAMLIGSIGVGIAEGDIMVVGIKVATDVIMGKYTLPSPVDPSHMLAQHELALFDAARTSALSASASQNRSAEYNRTILPMCENLMKAAGFRMAHEAAKQAGVDEAILEVFVSVALEHDPAWYSEHLNISQREQIETRDLAVDKVYPDIDKYLEELGVANFVFGPLVSPSSQLAFHNSLPTFVGNSVEIDLYQPSSTLKGKL